MLLLTKILRGSKKANERYVGPPNTFSIDTDQIALRLHDGVTPGGKTVIGIPTPLGLEDDNTIYGLQGSEWVPISTEQAFDAGPGETTPIAGTSEEGYFGEVPSTDLFTASELSLAVGLSKGNITHQDPGWLKFSVFGKTVFVAKKPLRHDVEWKDIYKAGLVYGVPGPGNVQKGKKVDQLRTVSKNGTTYKVRLLKGAEADPTKRDENIYWIPDGDTTSEWGRLMTKIHSASSEWDNLSNQELGVGWNSPGSHTLCQETFEKDDKKRVFRSNHDGAFNFFGSVKDKDDGLLIGWRPVLEVI